MEKLINLLNEFETPQSWIVFKSYDDYDWFFYWVDCDWETEIAWSDSLICSKKFWWISWLVENDKISNDWIKPRTDLVKEITIVDYKTGDAIWWKNKYTEVEQLIMYLSIQDEPIRFLCEIIK